MFPKKNIISKSVSSRIEDDSKWPFLSEVCFGSCKLEILDSYNLKSIQR
jgi:hypothetical protein